jgi:hypothetical protein
MRFQNSWTFPEERLSTVEVKHRGEVYRGNARCHPDDDWSELTGCRYAEMRAEIRALKADYKEKKAACEECRKFVKAVSQYKNFDRESPSAKAMFRQLNRRIREVNHLATIISRMEFNLRIAIRRQEEIKNR